MKILTILYKNRIYFSFIFFSVRCKTLNVTGGQVIHYGDQLGAVKKVQCTSGYTLQGSPVGICLPSGQWSGQDPQCQRKHIIIVDQGDIKLLH